MKYVQRIIVMLLVVLLAGCSTPSGSNKNASSTKALSTASQAENSQASSKAESSTAQAENSQTADQSAKPAETKTPELSAEDKASIDQSLEWKLAWSDEFKGSKIDPAVWGYEIGYIRNNELQYYTDKHENARIEKGNLVIEARREDYEGYKYTSASINTRGTKSFLYGKIEMRAKLPYGKGIWPAFWTMGDEFGWPACGEIDIMELIGGGAGRDDTIYGSAHWNDDLGHQYASNQTLLDKGIFADDYHIFSIEWDYNEIRWYLDGKDYAKQDITREDMATEFHQKHWILLNLAIGGSWPGDPDDTTIFPQKYLIDYVRVYQRAK